MASAMNLRYLAVPTFACNYQEEATERMEVVFFLPGCTDETAATTMKAPCRRMEVASTQKMACVCDGSVLDAIGVWRTVLPTVMLMGFMTM